ncbi:MAG: 6-bladed beta-propeller [Gemmatimonadetes bacterium]|nr:6-bladed beta-propeller [Gemmatimonadota bacterium]
MKARSLWIALSVAAASLGVEGCHGAGAAAAASGRAVESRDSAGVTLTTVSGAPAAVPRWRLTGPSVTLDGSGKGGAPYFQMVNDALWLDDGRIVVADAQASQLYLFDSTGVYLRSFGGQGNGPDEFRWVATVSITAGDTIAVYDGRQQSLKLFDPDAGFVRSVRIPAAGEMSPPIGAWPLGPGRIVRYAESAEDWVRAKGSFPQRWPNTATVDLLAADGEPVGRASTFDGEYAVVVTLSDGRPAESREPFSPRPVVSVGPRGVLFGTGASFELTELDSTFTPRLELRWPGFGRPIDAAEIAEVRAVFLGDAPTAGKRQYVDAILSKDLLPKTRPALGSAFVDGEGRIWAGSFEPWLPRPPVNREATWYVIDPARGSVARLDLPEAGRAHLSAVRGDRALVVTLDSLDVPSVGVYGIETTAARSGG